MYRSVLFYQCGFNYSIKKCLLISNIFYNRSYRRLGFVKSNLFKTNPKKVITFKNYGKMSEMDLLSTEVIGFIGAGNMAQAVAFRMIDAGLILPNNIIVSAPSDKNLILWKAKNVKTTNVNADVVKNASIVFIAVKPQYFANAAASIKTQNIVKCIVSFMAGKKLSAISEALGNQYSDSKIIRIMPSTPCLVGVGCSLMCSREESHYNKIVYKIMTKLGTCEIINENLFNASMAISGSSPAFLYMVMEALADGGVQKGVSRDLSIKMAAQAMKGAAEMVLVTGKHPGLLKDEVCSPGGTTIRGVTELEKNSIRSAFINAVSITTERAEELDKT